MRCISSYFSRFFIEKIERVKKQSQIVQQCILMIAIFSLCYIYIKLVNISLLAMHTKPAALNIGKKIVYVVVVVAVMDRWTD